MKLQLRELTDTRCSFVVDDVRPDIVNTLRRTLISRVPKMAIDEVEFHMGPIRDEEGREYDSNSALFDEIIAHRLSMVPIPTDLE
ncbi:MAG TPA: DNA-directed RNA polymerase subunit D, partial [Euryarchaeota archaeon]|nr:DNA-directed RNA polymerase subunit D [Euryarchaeota archaeon]